MRTVLWTCALLSWAASSGAQTQAQPPPPTPAPASPAAAQQDPGLDDVPTMQSAPATPAQPVTLPAAVTRALAKNPTYETALLEIRRAEAVVRETKAAWLPTLSGNASYIHLDNKRVSEGVVVLAQNELSANLTLTIPLVMTRQWLNTEEARLSADATQASAADARRTIAFATGRAYLEVYAQKFVIEVQERARDTARKHRDYAHQRFAGGVGTRLDEVRAAQEVATDEALVQSAYAGLSAAQEALGILVGTSGPLDTARDPTLPTPPNLTESLDDASRRTDVVALEVRRRAANKVVKDDWSDYAPYLAAIGLPFYQNPPIQTLPLTGYQAQLVLTVPLYDGGLRYGQHRERDALRDEAAVAYEAGLRQARSDVRAAFEAMRRADDALAASREAAALAIQALELANIAYRGGAVTNIEVIDAERQARDAETQAQVAADTARQARLAMLTAAGRFP